MAHLAPDKAPFAVAVSGGADSLALMHLSAGWAAAHGHAPPVVLTVDHRLSQGSKAVADGVAASAAGLGLEAHVLVWRGEKPSGDIEAAARQARYGLMGRWCRRHGIQALFVAHTLEDQAETFLLRLARGSGLDGLAGMQPSAPYPVPGFAGLAVMRPLLDIGRTPLRAFLAERAVTWHEDPMNADPRFARVRVRQAWPALAATGLTAARIAAAAKHLARARQALEAETDVFLAAHSAESGAGLQFDAEALSALPREIGLRALAALVMRAGGNAYRPRFERLERLYDAIIAGQIGRGRTLGHCRLAPAARRAALFGEASLVLAGEAARRSGKSVNDGQA